jgi:hypothetical protein
MRVGWSVVNGEWAMTVPEPGDFDCCPDVLINQSTGQLIDLSKFPILEKKFQ